MSKFTALDAAEYLEFWSNHPYTPKFAVSVKETIDMLRSQHAEIIRLTAERTKFMQLRSAMLPLLNYDSYSTEYDGQMLLICPSCGEQNGGHSDWCEFVVARAAIAAIEVETT